MRASPRRGLLSRALITVVLAGLLLVGLPVGPPVSSGGWPDLGLGRAWNAVVDLLRPDPAATWSLEGLDELRSWAELRKLASSIIEEFPGSQ
jgi:hypothetical protein